MSFQNLGLSNSVVHGVQRVGYLDPSPIQLRAIPVILSGRDVIASAQTGTGKTAAFALPLLSLLDPPGNCRVAWFWSRRVSSPCKWRRHFATTRDSRTLGWR